MADVCRSQVHLPFRAGIESTPDMTSRGKRVLILLVGWSFILLGIAGLFLPILQGILFLFIGLVILSSQYVWAQRLLARLRTRFPKLGRTADQAAAKASIWLRRLTGQAQ
ncbi:MAG: hypothetical protein DMG68_17720 [Acidobacteria bacterium]|nr:MAG: hypothetical protein DMG68_17720 [Acidobacteriota bacterium]